MPSITFLSRRQFCLSAAAGLGIPGLRAVEVEGPWSGPAVVRRVYLAARRASWPRPDLDLKQEVAEIEARIQELEKRYPGQIRFTGGELLQPGADWAAWMAGAAEADVILAFNITHGVLGLLEKLFEAGRPVLMFSKPYAGHGWTHQAVFAQQGRQADVLASSNFNDLDVYMRIFGSIRHLRKSKVIVVVPGAKRSSLADDFAKHFGTTFQYLTYEDLKTAYDAVDPAQARQAAEEFMRGALRIVEPGRDQIERALRFWLGAQNVLKQERANVLTMDCLGGINRGELPGYPCVTFSRLNDQGLYGICQAEIDCAMTELLLTSFSGKPGFLANLVMDTGRNEVIHSHCTAPTAMLGIGGPASPYIVRSHLETAAGVSLQVLMPIAETITVAKFENARRLMVSTGEVTGNVDSESGCRTQIRTRVKDARKMLAQFRTNVHRVIYYGDYTSSIEKMGRLMAFEVVQEM